MIAQHAAVTLTATYLSVGALGLLFFAHIASRSGEHVIERSASLFVNTTVVACLILLIPLVMAAAPFIALHALCFGRRNRLPVRPPAEPLARHKRVLPPGVCQCFSNRSRTPVIWIDPVELPAFLRRQIDPRLPARRR